MTTAQQQIEDFLLGGERIEYIKIGERSSWYGWTDPDEDPGSKTLCAYDGSMPTLPWDAALVFLQDWDVRNSYDYYKILVWTTHRVIFIHEYDSSRWLVAVPRVPFSGRVHDYYESGAD